MTANLQHYNPVGHLDADAGSLPDGSSIAWSQVVHLNGMWGAAPIAYATQEVDRGGAPDGAGDWPDGYDWDRVLADSFGPDAGWCGGSFSQYYGVGDPYHWLDPHATIGNAVVTSLRMDESPPQYWLLGEPCPDGAECPGPGPGTCYETTDHTRNAVAVRLSPAPRPVWLVNAHLPPHNYDEEEGESPPFDFGCELGKLFQGIDSLPADAIVLLTGDFNVGSDQKPDLYRSLRAGLHARGFGFLYSRGVDHVFVRDPTGHVGRLRVHAETPEGTVEGQRIELSDHDWLVSDLELSDPPETPRWLTASVGAAL